MSLNVDFTRKLRDEIAVSHSFDMQIWLHGVFSHNRCECGTPGCIAGHAIALAAKTGDQGAQLLIDELRINTILPTWASRVAGKAQELIGLDDATAENLFGVEDPDFWGCDEDGHAIDLGDITQEMAVAKLDELIAQAEAAP